MNFKRAILAGPRAVAMSMLTPYERRLLRLADDTKVRPVFILGPPRSGTTLLYELLVMRFRFSYISNLAHRLYQTPVAATTLGRRGIEKHRPRFCSRYGHVAGFGAPSEGGWMWTRWLPADEEASGSDLANPACETMRRTIAGLSEAMDGPFLGKSIAHTVQIPALRAVFPEAAFIEITREPMANADSIVRYRQAMTSKDGLDGWRSVKPQGWERFRNADVVIQGCAQLRLTRRAIRRGLGHEGESRRVVVAYEDLCADPERELRRVGAFLAAKGNPLEGRAEVMRRFTPALHVPRPNCQIARGLAKVDNELAGCDQHLPWQAVRAA